MAETATKDPSKPEESAEKRYTLTTEVDPVVTHHRLGEMAYTATTGMLP